MNKDKKNKNYIIFVFEDSSQSIFGGGQKITSYVCKILSDKHEIFIFDYTDKSRFQNKIKNISKNVFLLKKEERNILNIFRNIFFIYHITKNYKNTLFYCTTNRGLFYGWIFSFLNRKFVYHAHLARYKFLLKILTSKAEKILCVSNYVKEYIGKEQCVVINNATEFSK